MAKETQELRQMVLAALKQAARDKTVPKELRERAKTQLANQRALDRMMSRNS